MFFNIPVFYKYTWMHARIESAQAAIYRNQGLKTCEYCWEQLVKDKWGIFCPNDDCSWEPQIEEEKN